MENIEDILNVVAIEQYKQIYNLDGKIKAILTQAQNDIWELMHNAVVAQNKLEEIAEICKISLIGRRAQDGAKMIEDNKKNATIAREVLEDLLDKIK